MSNLKFHSCPKCGRNAVAEEGHQLVHSTHDLIEGVKQQNPFFIGVGLIGAAVHLFKQHVFSCEGCGKWFVSL